MSKRKYCLFHGWVPDASEGLHLIKPNSHTHKHCLDGFRSKGCRLLLGFPVTDNSTAQQLNKHIFTYKPQSLQLICKKTKHFHASKSNYIVYVFIYGAAPS